MKKDMVVLVEHPDKSALEADHWVTDYIIVFTKSN